MRIAGRVAVARPQAKANGILCVWHGFIRRPAKSLCPFVLVVSSQALSGQVKFMVLRLEDDVARDASIPVRAKTACAK